MEKAIESRKNGKKVAKFDIWKKWMHKNCLGGQKSWGSWGKKFCAPSLCAFGAFWQN